MSLIKEPSSILSGDTPCGNRKESREGTARRWTCGKWDWLPIGVSEVPASLKHTPQHSESFSFLATCCSNLAAVRCGNWRVCVGQLLLFGSHPGLTFCASMRERPLKCLKSPFRFKLALLACVCSLKRPIFLNLATIRSFRSRRRFCWFVVVY